MAEENAILAALRELAAEGGIGLGAAQQIARTFSCHLRNVEQLALSHSILPHRYKRNGLNCRKQLKILQSTVSIIGCGGLGGRCAELLARLGIGHILLTDPDTFSESNLNRQLFCTTDSIGQNKTEVVEKALTQINPALKTTCHIKHFDTSCIHKADMVVDALDSAHARTELSALCRKQSVPMIHGAVRQWYGRVGIDQQTNRLTEPLQQAKKDILPPSVLPMTVSLIASLQAAEVCKLILQTGSPLNNGWLQCDLLAAEYETIDDRRD